MDSKRSELAHKWVAALRSGDYMQGFGHLRMDGRYCCLGVLCDLVDPTGWGTDPAGRGRSSWLGHRCNITHEFYANTPDINLLGLSNAQVTRLMQANDGGVSFEEIADYIESEIIPSLVTNNYRE